MRRERICNDFTVLVQKNNGEPMIRSKREPARQKNLKVSAGNGKVRNTGMIDLPQEWNIDDASQLKLPLRDIYVF